MYVMTEKDLLYLKVVDGNLGLFRTRQQFRESFFDHVQLIF